MRPSRWELLMTQESPKHRFHAVPDTPGLQFDKRVRHTAGRNFNHRPLFLKRRIARQLPNHTTLPGRSHGPESAATVDLAAPHAVATPYLNRGLANPLRRICFLYYLDPSIEDAILRRHPTRHRRGRLTVHRKARTHLFKRTRPDRELITRPRPQRTAILQHHHCGSRAFCRRERSFALHTQKPVIRPFEHTSGKVFRHLAGRTGKQSQNHRCKLHFGTPLQVTFQARDC